MQPSLVIAGKDLKQRARDRTAYIVGIIAPLALAAIMSLAFGRSDQPFHATYAVVDLDGGSLASAFIDDVLGGPELRDQVTVRRVRDAAAAGQQAEDGTVAAAVVIPEGFSAAAQGGPVVPMQVVRNAGEPIGADVAVALAESFTAQLHSIRLAINTAVASGAVAHDESALAALAQRAKQAAIPVAMEESATQTQSPGAAFAPGMGIFFLYFVIAIQARSLVLERRRGTMVRLLAAPIRTRSLLAGKALAAFTLGLAALATTAVASTVLLDAEWGGLLPAAAIIAATVIAATSAIALVLTFARTEQQAALYGSLVTFSFALLGGNFISLARPRRSCAS
jgi:ABC-2 type transport system permease protein